ncbi:unnamed protein product [Moneuplotes crassus]|uniref:Uncharacterized protein n=1 Tax=Euplotes crassus TaxID=5936 RepID=A0AAD1XU10_EUPCR|nr:unnamed protein product [Moneuplotes crassus]
MSNNTENQNGQDVDTNLLKKLMSMKFYSKLVSLGRFLQIFKGSTPFCKHQGSCSLNVANTLLRNFSIGFFGETLLNILFKLLKTKSIRKTLQNIFTLDSVQLGAIVALVPAAYKLILCTLRCCRRKEDKYNSIIAGVISSLFVFNLELTPLSCPQNDARRKFLIFLVFARSLQSGAEILKNKTKIPVPNNWEDILLYLISVSFVAWAYFDWKVLPFNVYNLMNKNGAQKYNDTVMMEVIYRGIGEKYH